MSTLNKVRQNRQVLMVPVVLTELLSDSECPWMHQRGAISSSGPKHGKIWQNF